MVTGVHIGRKRRLSSQARQKVRGELYSVFQKSIEQLCQLIIVGCYSTMVVHFSVKETAEGSTPSNIQKRKVCLGDM